MVVDAHRLEARWIIIHIKPSLIAGLRDEEPAYTLILEEERAPVFAETHFQPSFVHGWWQPPPAKPVQCQFSQQMVVHCVKAGGACLGVIATRMQRAAPTILIFPRPRHASSIALE